MNKTLAMLQRAHAYLTEDSALFPQSLRIHLVTNFTDAILEQLIVGVALSEYIYPQIKRAPYKQFDLVLSDTNSFLYQEQVDMCIFFFDVNGYIASPFTTDKSYVDMILSMIEQYVKKTKITALVSTLPLPFETVYGHLYTESPLYKIVCQYNTGLQSLASRMSQVQVFDVNRLIGLHGERIIRDYRGLYAFDTPFTTDFLLVLATEWIALCRAHIGGVKKCIVLDLDNTLWGGVVGEEGPQGILLGPEYPGRAYQEFQRALLGCYERGIILAINSRNNPEDVLEVFQTNKNMILTEKHFGSIVTNWKSKAENFPIIAAELNIGIDSMVFFDDDPVNRDLVRQQYPDIMVPEFSLAPEQYVPFFMSQTAFHQFSLTDEDREKGRMYSEERTRRTFKEKSFSHEAYVEQLQLQIRVCENEPKILQRLAQLTQKTNQFNLTTQRYSEADLVSYIEKGGILFAGDVSDRFGRYGITILVMLMPNKTNKEAAVDSFLMSCRVMGRGVEARFFDWVLRQLFARGFERITSCYRKTKKNDVVALWYDDMGFTKIKESTAEVKQYFLEKKSYLKLDTTRTHQGIMIQSFIWTSEKN